MIEKDLVLSEYLIQELESFQGEQTLFVKDLTNKTIAKHSISPIQLQYFDKLFTDDNKPEIIRSGLPLFEERVDSYKPGEGIATALWKYAEERFFHLQTTPYLRFVHDISDSGWTESRVPILVQYLQSKGLDVACVWQDDVFNKPAWLLLFTPK